MAGKRTSTKPGKTKADATRALAEKQLRDRQTEFINCYLKFGTRSFLNAAESARQAGYSRKTARQMGYENLTKPYIRTEIKQRLKEHCLDSEEVLARLSDHARGSIEPFLQQSKTGEVTIDLTAKDAPLHLIKKVRSRKRSGGQGDKTWVETDIEIELHDPQAALVQLGRHHGLFSDKLVVETPVLVNVDR